MAVPDRAAIKEMMQRWRRTTDLVRKVGTAAAEHHERAGHRGKRARNGRTLGRRLNRVLTFEPSGRHQSKEAARYACVTAIAAGTNYAVFATLVVAALKSWPQAAVLAGAAAGALLSYNGHRIFSFARCRMALAREAVKHNPKVAPR